MLHDLTHVRNIKKKLILNKLIIEQWFPEAGITLVTFPLAVIRYPDKSNLRMVRLMLAQSLRIQSIMMKTSRHPALKQAGHTVSTGRK